MNTLYMKSSGVSSRSNADDMRLLISAISVSLLLHMGIYFLLPLIKSSTVQPFKRIEVEVNTVMPPQQETPAPTPPPVQSKPEPTPPQPSVKQPVQQQKPVQEQPVLASKSPDAPSDYVAPAVTTPVQATPQPTEEVKNTNPSQNSNSVAKPTESIATEQATPEEAWEGYGQAIYDMVSKNKSYPAIAIRRNWEGKVKVLAKFVHGQLVDVKLVDSSSFDALDREALAMLRKAINQIPISGSLVGKSFTITVPVDFKLSEQ